MYRSSRTHTRLALLLLCGALLLLCRPSPTAARGGDPCSPTTVKCVAQTLGIDLQAEAVPAHAISFGSRLVIFWWDGDCEYRQVVIVTVASPQRLQAIMTPLAANKWNAMGQVKRDDYQQALADGALRELFAEPPQLETCETHALPPCERPIRYWTIS